MVNCKVPELLYTVVHEKRRPFYFASNSVKNRLIFVVIGIQPCSCNASPTYLYCVSALTWIASLHYRVKLESREHCENSNNVSLQKVYQNVFVISSVKLARFFIDKICYMVSRISLPENNAFHLTGIVSIHCVVNIKFVFLAIFSIGISENTTLNSTM